MVLSMPCEPYVYVTYLFKFHIFVYHPLKVSIPTPNIAKVLLNADKLAANFIIAVSDHIDALSAAF